MTNGQGAADRSYLETKNNSQYGNGLTYNPQGIVEKRGMGKSASMMRIL